MTQSFVKNSSNSFFACAAIAGLNALVFVHPWPLHAAGSLNENVRP